MEKWLPRLLGGSQIVSLAPRSSDGKELRLVLTAGPEAVWSVGHHPLERPLRRGLQGLLLCNGHPLLSLRRLSLGHLAWRRQCLSSGERRALEEGAEGSGVLPGRCSWGEAGSPIFTLTSLARLLILFIFTFKPCKACRQDRRFLATRCQQRSAGSLEQPEPEEGTGHAPPVPPACCQQSQATWVPRAHAGHLGPAVRRG